MASVFNERASPRWPSGATARRRARRALRDLAAGGSACSLGRPLQRGRRRAAVDTLLMLRPTDSPTLFLQQLGRGLRKGEGQGLLHGARLRRPAPQEFRFDRRFRRCSAAAARRRASRSSRASRSCPPAATWSSTGRREIVLRSLREAVPSAGREGGGAAGAATTRPTIARRVPRRVRPRARRRLRRQPLVVRPVGCGRWPVVPAGPARGRPAAGRRPPAARGRRRAHRHAYRACSAPTAGPTIPSASALLRMLVAP
jgi:hypothetical protein